MWWNNDREKRYWTCTECGHLISCDIQQLSGPTYISAYTDGRLSTQTRGATCTNCRTAKKYDLVLELDGGNRYFRSMSDHVEAPYGYDNIMGYNYKLVEVDSNGNRLVKDNTNKERGNGQIF